MLSVHRLNASQTLDTRDRVSFFGTTFKMTDFVITSIQKYDNTITQVKARPYTLDHKTQKLDLGNEQAFTTLEVHDAINSKKHQFNILNISNGELSVGDRVTTVPDKVVSLMSVNHHGYPTPALERFV